MFKLVGPLRDCNLGVGRLKCGTRRTDCTIKLALLAYAVTAMALFALAGTGLLLAGDRPLKDQKILVERITGQEYQTHSQIPAS